MGSSLTRPSPPRDGRRFKAAPPVSASPSHLGFDFRNLAIMPPRETVRDVAAYGTGDGGGPLPHLGAIQRAFGDHDILGVQAHRGERAEAAAAALGARAYAAGEHVAFAGEPTLHTAAHEAAHVVQQRAGVYLPGATGRAGDVYETHADAVADRVATGRSAAPLLDRVPAAALGARPAVQLQAQPTPPGDGAFVAMLKKWDALAKANTPMARAIAKAYVNRAAPQSMADLRATTYEDDKVVVGPAPTEDDVFRAIVPHLDLVLMGKSWQPASGTRGSTEAEIADFAFATLAGGSDLKEIAKSEGKDAAFKLGAAWFEGEGLIVFAKWTSGIGEILAAYELACSIKELVIQLQKPVAREPTPQDRIIMDVTRWLKGAAAP